MIQSSSIQVEPTTVEWVHANFETDKAIDTSVGVWRVVDGGTVVFVIGVLRPSLLGWAELWLVMGHATRRVLRARRQLTDLLRTHFPCTSVHARGAVNERFARFFGFKQIGPQVIDGETWMRFEL
jgi:hypothetical protein